MTRPQHLFAIVQAQKLLGLAHAAAATGRDASHLVGLARTALRPVRRNPKARNFPKQKPRAPKDSQSPEAHFPPAVSTGGGPSDNSITTRSRPRL